MNRQVGVRFLGDVRGLLRGMKNTEKVGGRALAWARRRSGSGSRSAEFLEPVQRATVVAGQEVQAAHAHLLHERRILNDEVPHAPEEVDEGYFSGPGSREGLRMACGSPAG